MKNYYYLFLLFVGLGLNAQEFSWAKQFGGSGITDVHNMIVDDEGNIYLTGMFNETAYLGEDSSNHSITADGFVNIFIVKLSSDGDVIWMKPIGGSDFCSGYNLALDEEQSLYVIGNFTESVDFNPEGESQILTTESEDLFMLKLSNLGEFVWVKNLSGTDTYFEIGGMSFDETGNIYISGTFAGTVDFDILEGEHFITNEGYSDSFIAKYSPTGQLVWVNQIRDSGATSINFENNQVIVTGFFSGICDFDSSDEEYIVTSTAMRDAYVLYLNEAGEFQQVNTTLAVGFSTIAHVASEIDSEGNLFVIGSFFGEIDFSPNTEHGGAYTFFAENTFNTYVLKYNSAGEFVWIQHLSPVSEGSVMGYDLALDTDNNCLITGYLQNSVAFGDWVLNQQSAQYMEAFVARINAEGNFDYAKLFAGESDVQPNFVDVDAQGNIILSGTFEEQVNLNPDAQNMMVNARGMRDTYLIKMASENMDVVEPLSSVKFSIYPVPSKDFIYVNSSENLNGKSFEILDLTGRIVRKGILNHSSKIQISNLSKGIYFMKVNNQIQKLIVN